VFALDKQRQGRGQKVCEKQEKKDGKEYNDCTGAMDNEVTSIPPYPQYTPGHALGRTRHFFRPSCCCVY
jgi:hypothetical protein